MDIALKQYHSDDTFTLEVNGLTHKQARKLFDFAFDLAAPETLDPLLKCPQSTATAIYTHITNGHNSLPDGSPLSQKIADIKYVRSVSGAGLKEAKEWCETKFWYAAVGA